MNHKQLVQQMNEMKAELEALRNQVEAYENVETEIVKSPNTPTSRRRMLKRLALGAGAFAAATAAGAMSTGQQVLAETASANAIDAQGGDGGYGITVSTTAAGLAQLRLAPGANSGAPTDTTGRNIGEVYVDSQGNLFYLAATGAGGNTWRRLAGPLNVQSNSNSDVDAGNLYLLPSPDRFYDNRAGSTVGVNVGPLSVTGSAGTVPGGLLSATNRAGARSTAYKVPTGAKAILGNVTVIPTGTSNNASVKIFSGAVTDLSLGTSVIAFNPSNGMAVGNSFISALDGSGNLKIAFYNFTTGTMSVSFFIDIVGYYL